MTSKKMSNETQEQTQSRGRLLVIDDNPDYASNAIKAARARGYEVDVAFDLKGAMSYLQSGSYAGVITDLQFCEEGIDGNSADVSGTCKSIDDLVGIADSQGKIAKDASGNRFKVPYFERGTKAYEEFIDVLKRTDIKIEDTKDYQQAGEHSFELNPRANPELRQRIASELATPENASQLAMLEGRVGEIGRLFFGILVTQQGVQRDNMTAPAMGYEVIKYAQEHNIPLAVVSSVGHGQHCIPALFQTGLADARSLLRHESTRYSERKKILGEEYEEEFKQQFQRLDAIVLDRAILVMQNGKEQHTYDFAIDMLEGRIDQTRPYRLEE